MTNNTDSPENSEFAPENDWEPTCAPLLVQEWTINDMLDSDESDLLDSDDCELLGSDDLVEEDSLVG